MIQPPRLFQTLSFYNSLIIYLYNILFGLTAVALQTSENMASTGTVLNEKQATLLLNNI